jgi:hypothetical protein
MIMRFRPGEYQTDPSSLNLSRLLLDLSSRKSKGNYNPTDFAELTRSLHIRGQWLDEGRDWLTRDIVLEHFTPLAEDDRGHTESPRVIVEGYIGATVLDVDPGADIAFLRQR